MFEKLRFGIAKMLIGTEQQWIDYRMPQLIGNNSFNIDDSLNISTVYTCINILSSTMSRLPLEVYQTNETTGKTKDKNDPLYTTLHYNSNEYTTSNSFINYLETVRNLKGNSFARIRYKGRKPLLDIVYNWQMCGYGIINKQLYYFIKETEEGECTPVNSQEILHFKMMTRDGVWGINPIESLRANLSATHKGLKSIDNFYENNANSPKALKSTVGANQTKIIEALKKFQKEYAGIANAGKMIPLPPNTEIQELKLNFADAQFIDTIRFNAEQIAALYTCPPHRVGIITASKFNSVEFMTLDFKVNSIASIARMYRQEFEFKLLIEKQRLNGKSIEFNTNAMIELDHKAKTEGYQKLFQTAAISPNKIAEFENLPKDKNGDFRVYPMNMIRTDKTQNNGND